MSDRFAKYIVQALRELNPELEYKIIGEHTYSNIEWLNDNITPPTETEVNSKIDQIETDKPLNELRSVRNYKLTETDWTQGADSPLTDEKKTEWATYRQALRDITDTYTSLDDVEWPTKPA